MSKRPPETRVSRRFFEDLLLVLAARVDLEALLTGVAMSGLARHSGRTRVEWKPVAEILSRFELEPTREGVVEELGEALCGLRGSALGSGLAGLVVSPRRLVQRQLRRAVRRALPLLQIDIESLPDGRLWICAAIRGAHPPCPQLFRLAAGLLRAAPRRLRLPDAIVSADVQPARGEFRVVLPPSGTLWARVARALRALFSVRASSTEMIAPGGQHERDIVELRAAYAVLEESESHHRSLLENSGDIIAELDYDGLIRYVSPSVEERTGFRPDELVGTNLSDWCHPLDLDEAKRHFDLTPPGGDADRPTYRIRHRSEGWLWMESDTRGYRDADGEVRVIATLRDVTRRVATDGERRWRRLALEAELDHQRERLKRRDQLLADMRRLLHGDATGGDCARR